MALVAVVKWSRPNPRPLKKNTKFVSKAAERPIQLSDFKTHIVSRITASVCMASYGLELLVCSCLCLVLVWMELLVAGLCAVYRLLLLSLSDSSSSSFASPLFSVEQQPSSP